MGSRYDDELWETVPADPGPPPGHLAHFVDALPHASLALDLGCGDGRLATRVSADRLVAADVSRVALERASRRLPNSGLLELQPDEPLPLEDASFDLVVCIETIEHVRDVQLFLSEARRVLRPRGTLALSTPAYNRLTVLRALVLGLDRVLDPLSPHLRFFTRRSLARLLGEMGFEVESIERTSGTLLARARR